MCVSVCECECEGCICNNEQRDDSCWITEILIVRIMLQGKDEDGRNA